MLPSLAACEQLSSAAAVHMHSAFWDQVDAGQLLLPGQLKKHIHGLQYQLLGAWAPLVTAPGLLSSPAGRAAVRVWLDELHHYRLLLTCSIVDGLREGLLREPRCGEALLRALQWPPRFAK